MRLRDLDKEKKRRLIITFACYVLVGVLVLGYFLAMLTSERQHAHDGWGSYLQDEPEQAALAQQLGATATEVSVGTYVENLREINLQDSFFRVEFLVWFNWQGAPDLNPAGNFRVYKGVVNSKELVTERSEGGQNYQLVRMDVSVSKSYDTRRFPLESHQLRFYVESTCPIQQVVFVPDRENSGLNKNLTITGYNYTRHDIGAVTYLYESTHGDPLLEEHEMSSEIVTALEINRASLGMYFKCFIALAGTIVWVLIALFINTYHHVDPLGMIPGALFGAVSNIMVGAALLPDALEMGLLEYVNLYGVLTILGVTIAIININRVRKRSQEDKDYAHLYGQMLFFTILVLGIGGQILLPLAAYAW